MFSMWSFLNFAITLICISLLKISPTLYSNHFNTRSTYVIFCNWVNLIQINIVHFNVLLIYNQILMFNPILKFIDVLFRDFTHAQVLFEVTVKKFNSHKDSYSWWLIAFFGYLRFHCFKALKHLVRLLDLEKSMSVCEGNFTILGSLKRSAQVIHQSTLIFSRYTTL